MHTNLFIADRHSVPLAILGFTDGALTGMHRFKDQSALMENILQGWKEDGIDVIGEAVEKTEAGEVNKLYSEKVPLSSPDSCSAIRLWARRQGHIDIPLPDEAVDCAKSAAALPLLPLERLALIQGLVRLSVDELKELEIRLASC